MLKLLNMCFFYYLKKISYQKKKEFEEKDP